MGLDINSVQFLLDAHEHGVSFERVLTLGRQDLNVFPARMIHLLRRHALSTDAFEGGVKSALYAEPLFTALGAAQVDSMDASSFEGASVVHDLNQPVPDKLMETYDVVYDGGTLEHVFQFPTALANCMKMIRRDGHLFLHTVTNNYCGHGFYQFSPELFYRALSPENGFKMERMILHGIGPYGRWYEVQDPDAARARVELISLRPMQLLIQARRTRITPVFASAPQQSDYTPRWDQPRNSQGTDGDKPVYAPVRPSLAESMPGLARLLNVIRMGWSLLKSHSLWNRRSFRPVSRGRRHD